jgi:predicted component of type VI protein secretion system
VSFPRPRAFQLGDVVTSIPALAGLKQIADGLGAGDTPDPEAVVAKVRDLAGDGLADAVAKAFTPPAAAPKKDEAARAVDAIVGSMRTGASKAGGSRAARAAIEEALYAAASEVLRDPQVARLESAWRGLKLLCDQCPPAASTAIEVVDVGEAGVLAALERDLPEDSVDHPDLYVVVDPCDDPAVLSKLADAAEGLLAPVLVAVSPKLFGVTEAGQVAARAELERGGLPEKWPELRAEETTRWLCAVVNRVVVAREGVGAAKRAAFASPAFALAAMLAASFRETRSFARILGSVGALEAPGSWELPEGRDAGTSIPTEAFVSITSQGALAKHGVLGVGSGRNTAKVTLSEMPMVRESKDAAPLSAQILTGRIARFARWVSGQVPPGASDQEAASLFEEAAKVFLFAGLEEGQASLRAGVGKDKEGARMVEIACRLPAPLAGVPFQMAFAIPLR